MGKIFSGIIGGAIGFLIGGPAGAAIGFGIGMTKVGEKIVNKVMDFVTKPFLGALGGMPDAGAYDSQREEGVVITKRGGGTEQIPIVYGFRQVGGIITFATTGSDRNRYLWVAYSLSEGPVEGIHSLFIDDNDVTQANLIGALNRGEAVEITSGKYNGRVKMQFWYGKNFGGNASSSPVGANLFFAGEAPGWRTTDAYNGLATLFVRYEWKQVTTQEQADNNPFSGNIPSIKVNLLGRRVLPIDGTAQSRDWFTDVNAGRERYSTNPAEILLDYLRHPYYGKGLSNSEIDWASFQTARDKYNQDVTYVNGVRGPILTTNCVLDSGVTLMGNVKTLLAGCRSYMPYVQGKYKLKVEDAGNPTDILSGSATVVATFTPDNIVGDISWGGVPRDSVFSEFEVTYVDPGNKWSTNTVVYPVTEAERIEYQVLDGGRVNKGSATFSTLTNYAMAYDMARLLFFKSRTQETLNLKVTSQAIELEPGDNIQVSGNTLEFVTGETAVPWRIVSIRANDDYSFDLGCVSNPDSIYPHARAGERDIVLPPFIPRYESIVYPTTDVDLSLYPPSYAYTGDGAIVSPLDPPGATDPTSGTGGGVGDQNGEQNQNPITVPPPPAPPVVEVFNHYIQIDRVDYVVTNNLVTATFVWTQPDSPSYAGVDFWYKRNISTETVYQTTSSTQTPGIGRQASHSIAGLIKGNIPYVLIGRVRYSNGNSSTFTTTVALNTSGAISTENPVDYEATVGAGWSLPTQAANNPRDTIFSSLTGISSLDGSSNRLLAITLTQDINNPSGLNSEVSGVNIYYKLSANTYWKKHSEQFNGSYFPAQSYTFTPNLDLGIGNPSPDDASDNFDFIFRFTYRDGTESQLQRRYMGVDVQGTGDRFIAVQVMRSGQEPIGDFAFLTEEQAPPGSVVDTRNITIGLTDAVVLSNPNRLTITINPPDVSNRINWYGVRVRYRKVPLAGGVAPAFTQEDIFPVPQPNAGVWQFRVTPVDFAPESYQIIITPIVRYSGAQTEANTSWIGQGTLDPNFTGNQIPRLGFRTIESAQIPGITAEPFPTANPKVLVRGWRRIIKNNNAPVVNNRYYELEYNADHITGLTGVRIYRRSNTGNSIGVTTSLHKGLGRWEYIDVDTTAGTGNAQVIGGNVVVNLRMPIGQDEFNPYYLIGSSSQPLVNGSFSWATKKIVADEFVDIVVVAQTSAGFSEVGMQMPRLIGSTIGTITTTALPQEITVSAYNNYTAGYLRNIAPGADGSRANVTGATLWTATSTAASNAFVATTPNRGRPVL
jgi:Putative phage tail protein